MKSIITSVGFLLFQLLLLCHAGLNLSAQPQSPPTAFAHSHNDYLQSRPLQLAYSRQFGSVEADIFLLNDSLFVAHTRREIQAGKTLDYLYLKPLSQLVENNGGSVFPNSKQPLQVLIDLKTGYEDTLKKLVEELKRYESMLYPEGTIKIVISGNTPPPSKFNEYPAFIFFDGRPETSYTQDQLKHLGLISQSFTKYSKWNGQKKIAKEDFQTLQKIVETAQKQGKPFRFWANPDTPEGWKLLLDLKVDYLNTDKIDELSAFLNARLK